jgi:hypothetical protein
MPTEEASTAATRLPNSVIGPITVVAAVLSSVTTFLVLAKLTFVGPTPNVVVTLLAVNLITVLLLLAIIGREFWHIVVSESSYLNEHKRWIQAETSFTALISGSQLASNETPSRFMRSGGTPSKDGWPRQERTAPPVAERTLVALPPGFQERDMLAIQEFNAAAITYLAYYASRALCLRRNTGRRVTASQEAVAHSRELMVKIDALVTIGRPVWRDSAQAALVGAETMRNADARRMMRELAMQYEDLAALVENAVLRRDEPTEPYDPLAPLD